MKKPPFALLLLFLLIGVIAISFSAIFIKWSYAPSGVLGMNRLLLTVILMTPWVWKKREEFKRLSRREWWLLLCSGMFLGLHFLGWISSLRYTSVASSMIVMNSSTIFVMLGAFLFFRERVRWQAMVGVVMAIIGTIWIAGADVQVGGTAFWGDCLAVFGSLTVAIHMLMGQKLRQNISFVIYSYVVFSVAVIVLGGWNLATGVSLFSYPAREWGIFLLLAVVPTVFGHIWFSWLLQYVNATTIQVSVLGEPVGTILLAYLLLGESITPTQIGGGILSIIGIAWYIWMQKGRVKVEIQPNSNSTMNS